MMELVDQVTPLKPDAVVLAMLGGYRALVGNGQDPSPEVLACIVAQSAIETLHWKAIHWHNFGNLKASAKYCGDITFFGCNEVLKDKVYWFHPSEQRAWPGTKAWIAKHPSSQPNDNQCRWMAFQRPGDGAAAQIGWFRRHINSWNGLQTGNPRTFAAAMKKDCYFTAKLEDYTANGKRVMGYASLLENVFGKYYRLCSDVFDNQDIVEPAVHVEDTELVAPNPSLAAKLSDSHVDLVMEHLRSIVIEIPWMDIARHNRQIIASED
jgi:hypothetical protein